MKHLIKASMVGLLALPLAGCNLVAKVQEIPESTWKDICDLVLVVGGAIGRILALLGIL